LGIEVDILKSKSLSVKTFIKGLSLMTMITEFS